MNDDEVSFAQVIPIRPELARFVVSGSTNGKITVLYAGWDDEKAWAAFKQANRKQFNGLWLSINHEAT